MVFLKMTLPTLANQLMFYGHYESNDDRRCDLVKVITIQSQIMMKLKPMKSPSTPPQSATREPKEKASSSLITCIESLPNDGARLETGRGYLDFSMIYKRKRGHHVDVLFA